MAATKTKQNKTKEEDISQPAGREEPEICGGDGEQRATASTAPQVGHHPELRAQQLHHLLERGWRPSTNSFTPVTSFYKCGVTSFYKCGGVLIPEAQLQLLQDQHTPSLRGCSRVARQAPMWVVVRSGQPGQRRRQHVGPGEV